MDGIIAIIVIIAAISKVLNAGKAVKKNAPGQTKQQTVSAERPVQTVTPPKPASMQPIQPTVRPAEPVSVPSAGTFWQQLTEALREEQKPAEKKQAEAMPSGHEAAGRMPEGDSRECEHGSIGGSMAYEAHQEGRERKQKSLDTAPEQESMYRPAMNAAEMRRAVVMAEILKRPGERMAEQARRWSVR